MEKKVTIEIFSDVLCIWAYGAQARLDQLKEDHGEQVGFTHRLIPVFAAAHQRIEEGWKDKGSYAGFNRHLHEVASGWDHVSLHPDVWLSNPPESSQLPHLYLKAVQLLEERGEIPVEPPGDYSGYTLFEAYAWRVRRAFFAEALNVSSASALDGLAEELGLPMGRIHELIDCGSAHAALHLDTKFRDQYLVPGSPTMVFNEGRQRLYGNIGYRIIDANIRELLHNRNTGEASWC